MNWEKALARMRGGKRVHEGYYRPGDFLFLMDVPHFRMVTDFRAADVKLKAFICFYSAKNNTYTPYHPDAVDFLSDWLKGPKKDVKRTAR